jgi:predicted glycosyltransferase
MTVWIDLDNAPHVHFFAPIVRELQRRRVPVVLTLRDFSQTVELARASDLEFSVIGDHRTPRTTSARVAATFKRAGQLAWHIGRRRPSIAISHGSRALTLAAAGLRIPVMTMFDYEFVSAGLFFSLSRRVLMPEVVANELGAKGNRRNKLVGYPGFKEDVYVHDFVPDHKVVDQLSLDATRTIIAVRPPATWAHYHNEHSEVLFRALIERLRSEANAQIVMLARTAQQAQDIRVAYSLDDRFRILSNAVDGLSLMWYSDAVFSGGGTMIREAALLGVPAYSTFAGTLGAADESLIHQGKLVMIRKPSELDEITFAKRSEAGRRREQRSPTQQFIVDQIIQFMN